MTLDVVDWLLVHNLYSIQRIYIVKMRICCFRCGYFNQVIHIQPLFFAVFALAVNFDKGSERIGGICQRKLYGSLQFAPCFALAHNRFISALLNGFRFTQFKALFDTLAARQETGAVQVNFIIYHFAKSGDDIRLLSGGSRLKYGIAIIPIGCA